MKQEPVAWMDEYGNICLDIHKKMYQRNITAQYNYDKNTIPLYTEPQYRELSDEEIWDLFQQTQHNAMDFARAILKKASEK